ncbi:MAG: hypothetical protein RIK87_19750 [Fuerstiella sp.]
MNKLSLWALLLSITFFAAGCGGSGAPEGGAVNTGAGEQANTDQDPESDAGVGTDPALMDPFAGQEKQ